MSVKTLVIDASVALKWRLLDEEATSEAADLLLDFTNGQIELITPSLFDYEVANALKIAIVKGRITEPEALQAVIDFSLYEIERHEFHPYQTTAFQLACQYQRTVYDAAYLVLAQAKGLDFYTGDKRLFNATGQKLTWVKWIGDYQPV